MTEHRHQIIPEEKLQKDVLIEIHRNHKLAKCPLCGGELTEPLCTGKVMVPQESGSYGRPNEYEYKGCGVCKIIWRLELFNYTNERGDGMISDEGHQLFLEGWRNCFCRSRIFEHFIFIEESEGPHSRLGSPCPNIQKKKNKN